MACNLQDIVDEIEDALSSFDATVTGDVASSFSGNAAFAIIKGQSTQPQASSFTAILENKNNPDESITLGIILEGTGDGVPVGTYNATLDNQDVIVSLWYEKDANTGFIVPNYAKTNSITLTKVQENQVEGTFNFNLTDVLEEVNVTGSFVALGTTETQ